MVEYTREQFEKLQSENAPKLTYVPENKGDTLEGEFTRVPDVDSPKLLGHNPEVKNRGEITSIKLPKEVNGFDLKSKSEVAPGTLMKVDGFDLKVQNYDILDKN